MDRRAFLTLIAAAPIAALAPLPKVLEQRRYFVGIVRPDPFDGLPMVWRNPYHDFAVGDYDVTVEVSPHY